MSTTPVKGTDPVRAQLLDERKDGSETVDPTLVKTLLSMVATGEQKLAQVMVRIGEQEDDIAVLERQNLTQDGKIRSLDAKLKGASERLEKVNERAEILEARQKHLTIAVTGLGLGAAGGMALPALGSPTFGKLAMGVGSAVGAGALLTSK